MIAKNHTKNQQFAILFGFHLLELQKTSRHETRLSCAILGGSDGDAAALGQGHKLTRFVS